MALNLSTLTGATSGEVLAEALTTADFLEPCPVLRNLARGSQKGGDAKQDVALNQPKALPLIKNPSGDLGGYLYIPDVAGNSAEGPSVTIGSNQTWEGEVDMVITEWGSYIAPMGGGSWSSGFGILFYGDGDVRACSKGVSGDEQPSGVTLGTPFNAKYGYDGTNQYVKINDSVVWSNTAVDQSSSITHPLRLSAHDNLTHQGNYAIQKAKLTVNSAVVFDCDFNGSTSIRHGDTKFNCVGGPVSLIRAGQDPVTVVKKDILRFDGVNDALRGVFANNINGGYMFAAFSVLGNGGLGSGSGTDARLFSVNATADLDYSPSGFVYGLKYGNNNDLAAYGASAYLWAHNDMYDDDRGDILYESKAKSGGLITKVNNANKFQPSTSLAIASNEFNVGNGNLSLSRPAALDLEFLAVFPASITDDQADSVRNYINNRNNVFDLKDGFGYYFYDATKAPVGAITTGSSSWNGRIVGSDNGDSDRYLTQGTTNDAPVGDGYVVTFADNTDHLDIPSTTQAGWQVVGTSLGTFAYRVNANAVTELNLLGNFGHANTRQTGDLYGIILLPESATGADIESARKLLIDRGSSDALSATVLYTYWYQRADIVHFENVDMSSAVNVQNTWDGCSNMVTFEVTDISNGNNFSSAWNGCSALTSFPAGAKLGTAANSVSFTSAWESSGLTSFSTPLPTVGTAYRAWRTCLSLVEFTLQELSAFSTSQSWYGCSSLTSFSTRLPSTQIASRAWINCSSLTDFSADVFANWNPSSISTGVFNDTWDGCTSLTAQSVENILVSIDASGHYATTNKVSGGTPIANAGIDIDYNVATGSLSAATNSAIDSLSGKGWEVFINGVLVIPNILDLEPAAAYSLRSFDSDADPVVVNVRRSSDSASSNFKASEVSDGTLTDWVNNVVTISPTLNNGGFEDGATGWNLSNAAIDTTDFYTGSKSVKLTVTGGANSYILKSGVLQAGASFRVGFWARISDATKELRVEFGGGASSEVITFSSTNWEYKEVTKTAIASGFAFERNSSSGDYTINIDDITLTQLTADGHVTTWYDQGGTNHAAQSDDAKQPKLVDGGTLVTEGGLPSINFTTEVSNLSLNHSDIYGQATLDSYYVTKSTGNEYIYPSLVFNASVYGMVARSGDPYTDVSNHYGSPVFYANGNQITGGTRDTLHTATSGVQKLVAHIGADTTDSRWGTASMNFGNYNNNQASSIYSFTGKLQEMIFFNTDQSANRTGIEANIMDTYSIS